MSGMFDIVNHFEFFKNSTSETGSFSSNRCEDPNLVMAVLTLQDLMHVLCWTFMSFLMVALALYAF
jgi:hypothetical protein